MRFLGELELNYKEILASYAASNKRRRKQMVAAIKTTVCALVLCLATLCVLFIVDLVGGGDGGRVNSKDKTPPTIQLINGDCIYMYAGETVSFRNKVRVNDDSGAVTLDFDSRVNVNVPGTYDVIYTATDAAGNVSKLAVRVVVTKQDYTYGMLMSRVESLVKRLGITSQMSKQEQIFAVYNFVNSPDKTKYDANIFFSDESNTPNIDRANWQSDWIEEAIRTLDSGEGDCYSYYSVSKACFEYLGIENMGIRRDESQSNMSGTHFWLIVNIGKGNADEWYFYDATRLGGKFQDGTRNGCLRTYAELEGYVPTDSSEYGFYAFDGSAYPKTATTPIDR